MRIFFCSLFGRIDKEENILNFFWGGGMVERVNQKWCFYFHSWEIIRRKYSFVLLWGARFSKKLEVYFFFLSNKKKKNKYSSSPSLRFFFIFIEIFFFFLSKKKKKNILLLLLFRGVLYFQWKISSFSVKKRRKIIKRKNSPLREGVYFLPSLIFASE